MTAEEIQKLLASISQTLGAIKDFSVFEEITDRGSYYTMSDVGIGDAIQALDEIVCGMENVNSFEGGESGDEEKLPDTFLSEFTAAILQVRGGCNV